MEGRWSILTEIILHLKNSGKIFAEGNGQTNAHACDMLLYASIIRAWAFVHYSAEPSPELA